MKLTPDKLKNLLTKHLIKSLVFELNTEERKGKLRNQVKENWLIAWSAVRSTKSISEEIFHTNINWTPRTPKETKPFIKLAKKCFEKREDTKVKELTSPLNTKIEFYLYEKNFMKRWTGWKYTWVKKEEFDVPF